MQGFWREVLPEKIDYYSTSLLIINNYMAAIYATVLVEIKPGKKQQKKNLILGYTRKMVFF